MSVHTAGYLRNKTALFVHFSTQILAQVLRGLYIYCPGHLFCLLKKQWDYHLSKPLKKKVALMDNLGEKTNLVKLLKVLFLC